MRSLVARAAVAGVRAAGRLAPAPVRAWAESRLWAAVKRATRVTDDGYPQPGRAPEAGPTPGAAPMPADATDGTLPPPR